MYSLNLENGFKAQVSPSTNQCLYLATSDATGEWWGFGSRILVSLSLHLGDHTGSVHFVTH